jgi:protein associated with RNAse G/E
MDRKASECELSSTVKGFVRKDGGSFYCTVVARLTTVAAAEVNYFCLIGMG